jgi:hypothetical protein
MGINGIVFVEELGSEEARFYEKCLDVEGSDLLLETLDGSCTGVSNGPFAKKPGS